MFEKVKTYWLILSIVMFLFSLIMLDYEAFNENHIFKSKYLEYLFYAGLSFSWFWFYFLMDTFFMSRKLLKNLHLTFSVFYLTHILVIDTIVYLFSVSKSYFSTYNKSYDLKDYWSELDIYFKGIILIFLIAQFLPIIALIFSKRKANS